MPSLDGLRAVAVAIVFVAHAGLWFIPGNFGVTIFFFLSGYLITTLLRLEVERRGRIDFRGFYLRRAFRILPPFYLVLGIASALTAFRLLDGSLDPKALAAQSFHLTNWWVIAHGWWDGRAPGTWIYWSLAVEEHFYLAFPLFFALLSARIADRGRQAQILLALCLAVLVWRLILVFYLHAPRDREYIATDTRIDSILFGCVLAVWGNPALDRPLLAGRRLGTSLVVASAVLIATFAVHREMFEQSIRYSLQGLALFPFFIAAVTRARSWPFRILNTAPARHLGALSYSMYLLHPTVLYAVHQWFHPSALVQALASLAATLLLAEAMYRIVERPLARLRRRFAHVRRTEESTEVPVAAAAPAVA